MRFVLFTSAALVLAGCSSYRDTLLPEASPSAPTRVYTLDLPEHYEVRNVDFDASLTATGKDSNNVDGRSYVKVYAVDRRTGEDVLLVYENLGERAAALAVVRFRRVDGDQAAR